MTDEPDPRPNPRPKPRDPAAGSPPDGSRRASRDDAARPSVRRAARDAGRVNRPDPDATTPAPALAGARAAADAPRGFQPAPPPPPLARPGGGPPPYAGSPNGVHPDDDGEWVVLPRRSGPLRRAAIVLVVLALIVGVTGVTVVRWVNNEIHPPGDPGAPVEFTVEQGDTTNEIANNLAKEGVIGNATVFRYWLRRQDGVKTFEAGKYDLFENMDYPDLLETLRAGPRPPVSINVTVPPGLTFGQMKERLLELLPGFDPTEFDAAVARGELNAPWAPPVGPYPAREGL
ncbi:MAG TPA: endolytic transglycosylase MltG, partial [Acidimicrobiales bacterium]